MTTMGTSTDASTAVRSRLPLGARLGALGLAIPLVGGRWGSYIGIAPVYLADLLLALGVLCTVVLPRNYPSVRLPKLYWLLWTGTVAFLIVSLLHGYGDFVTRVRDLVPWYYLLLLPAVMQWALAAGPRRILNYLTVTLLAHAAWAIPALARLLPPLDFSQPVFGIPWFEVRPDVDVPLLAAAVVLVFYRWGSRATTLTFAILTAGAAAAQTSRAALVGSLLAVVIFARVRGHLNGAQAVVRLLGVSAVAAVIILVLLPALSARPADSFDKGALARAGLYGSTAAESSGNGTANARFQAWEVLLEHYAEEGYPALGDGAGAEIIRDTKTVPYFGGDVATRAPHNWWVHVLVRTGYVGTLLWLGLLVSGAQLTRGSLHRESDRSSFFTAMGALMMSSIVLTSTFGVVIEAPFGSQVLLIGAALFGLRAQKIDYIGFSPSKPATTT